MVIRHPIIMYITYSEVMGIFIPNLKSQKCSIVGNTEVKTNRITNMQSTLLNVKFFNAAFIKGTNMYNPISIYKYHMCFHEFPFNTLTKEDSIMFREIVRSWKKISIIAKPQPTVNNITTILHAYFNNAFL